MRRCLQGSVRQGAGCPACGCGLGPGPARCGRCSKLHGGEQPHTGHSPAAPAASVLHLHLCAPARRHGHQPARAPVAPLLLPSRPCGRALLVPPRLPAGAGARGCGHSVCLPRRRLHGDPPGADPLRHHPQHPLPPRAGGHPRAADGERQGGRAGGVWLVAGWARAACLARVPPCASLPPPANRRPPPPQPHTPNPNPNPPTHRARSLRLRVMQR